ncbi:MAG TPA: AmmeMemoRadiSam system radical SAM enzyme [Nitrospirae bacterium]|nr:AmmeMemoRadiSam system radical SAM enzyme [Nitrospirota bacterium]
MKEAMFYEKLKKLKVRCFLCAHHCIISEGRRGICGVRENREGILYTLVYGKLVSMNIDPIEKKPLFHFYPASTSMSVATVGCNFKCLHCQNYDISQYPKEGADIPGDEITPEQLVDTAERAGCKSISYTYTEPTIFFEFAYDCARLAHERGIKNVFVSNGYTGPEATKAIAPFLDGNDIDLKGDNEFYRKICGARLQPVLDTIKLMKELGVWVEVTTLIIPSHNDSEETLNMIIEYIKSVDPAIPWHVTQFYPTYRLLDGPGTPVETLRRARETGLKSGLKYVYEGNVPGEGGENTYCPDCGELLIERFGYRVLQNRIKDGRCLKCRSVIDGVWI